jgi:hypothetical protein
MKSLLTRLSAAGIAIVAITLSPYAQTQQATQRWFKGNTHIHTSRSDGDSTPEEVTKWYKENGYNFLFITDHETITPVETLNSQFGSSGGFLVFYGQEITDRLNKKPYHVNGLGLTTVVMPKHGTTIVQNVQLNIDAVRRAGGVPQVNHPNFGWALTHTEISQLKNVNLMEIYNGHPLVNNLGGGGVPSVEEIWDKLLTAGKLIYGVASDDVHSVRKLGDRSVPTPGHGWVMVNAATLDQKSVMEALDRGDFYASTGVELESYFVTESEIRIAVKQERWSKYRIQFVGRNGKILNEALESPAAYKIRGNEGYIRVRVLESNGKMAWTQPVFIKPRIKPLRNGR